MEQPQRAVADATSCLPAWIKVDASALRWDPSHPIRIGRSGWRLQWGRSWLRYWIGSGDKPD